MSGDDNEPHVSFLLSRQEEISEQELPLELTDKVSRVAQAKREIANRAARLHHIGGEYFGEVAWEMLLDLYVAEHENREISVSSLGIASGGPHTTALRWMRILEQDEVIRRFDHISDGRRRLVELTDKGRNLLDAYFEQRPHQLS